MSLLQIAHRQSRWKSDEHKPNEERILTSLCRNGSQSAQFSAREKYMESPSVMLLGSRSLAPSLRSMLHTVQRVFIVLLLCHTYGALSPSLFLSLFWNAALSLAQRWQSNTRTKALWTEQSSESISNNHFVGVYVVARTMFRSAMVDNWVRCKRKEKISSNIRKRVAQSHLYSANIIECFRDHDRMYLMSVLW